MIAAEGILTARGGVSSHAALVARQMGKVCVCGASALQVDYHAKHARPSAARPSRKASSFPSTAPPAKFMPAKSKPPRRKSSRCWSTNRCDAKESRTYQYYAQLMKWCDKATRMTVRTNADSPEQAANAIAFGAVGIGLCRTEHMFFEGDRIDAMREMILADNMDDRKKALAKLLPYQRDDFIGIFTRIERLARPPSVSSTRPCTNSCRTTARPKASWPRKWACRSRKSPSASINWHEFNPMLGLRGCRLGIAYPEISEMQARAVFEAAAEVQKKGIKVKPEIMIPLVGFPQGIAIADRSRQPRGRGSRQGKEDQVQLSGRHHDRNSARRAGGGRNRQGRAVLQLRHQRPDPDHAWA